MPEDDGLRGNFFPGKYNSLYPSGGNIPVILVEKILGKICKIVNLGEKCLKI